jgi:hypothetical protein
MSLDHIECTQRTIQEIQYITIATIRTHNDSQPMSQPWNSPVYSAFDHDYNFYWVSDRHSQHSRKPSYISCYLQLHNSRGDRSWQGSLHPDASKRAI